MTPEEHADAVMRKWEEEWYGVNMSALEDMFTAAIREHEAEVRQEYAGTFRYAKPEPGKPMEFTE